jgi:hypothetical protein
MGSLVNNNLKGSRRKQPNSRSYPSIYLEGLNKTTLQKKGCDIQLKLQHVVPVLFIYGLFNEVIGSDC